MTSRASRAVNPMMEQVSNEEEVQEIEESTSDDDEQDHCVSHGIDDESVIEREARQLRRQRHAHRPPTVEHMREHLRTHRPYRVPALCVWTRSQHPTSTKKSL